MQGCNPSAATFSKPTNHLGQEQFVTVSHAQKKNPCCSLISLSSPQQKKKARNTPFMHATHSMHGWLASRSLQGTRTPKLVAVRARKKARGVILQAATPAARSIQGHIYTPQFPGSMGSNPTQSIPTLSCVLSGTPTWQGQAAAAT